MGAKTKKAGSAGRFGARYGVTLKQKVNEIEKRQKAKYECPACNKIAVKRKFKGVWQCARCEHTFTAKAFAIGE